MTQCYSYPNGHKQCPNQAVNSGLCKPCFDKMAGEKERNAAEAAAAAAAAAVVPSGIPASAIKFTKNDLQRHFGALTTVFKDKKYSGNYIGGNAGAPHVHEYNGPGAHVKVGEDTHVFLDTKSNKFKKDDWAAGVEAVRSRNQPQLLAAMALTLCRRSGLPEEELMVILSKHGMQPPNPKGQAGDKEAQ